MTKTIISIISTVSLLSVGSSALAEYRNIYGETLQQQQQRQDMEFRIKKMERQQRQQQHQQWMRRRYQQY